MERMSIWPNPVTMQDIRPPELHSVRNLVYIRNGCDLEVVRCINVGETLLLPDSIGDGRVTCLGVGSVSNCSGLTSVTLPRYMRCIDDYAFFQCEKLEDVRMPEGMRVVGERAFAQCTGLRMLYVPPTVLTISETAFEGVRDLTLAGMEGSAVHRYAMMHGLFFMTAGGPNAA